MNFDELPPELARFEARLRRDAVDPPQDLAAKIMRAVEIELANRRPAPMPGDGNWRFFFAIAAILLIGMSLSMTAASVTRFVSIPPEPRAAARGPIASDLAAFPGGIPQSELNRTAWMISIMDETPRLPDVRVDLSQLKREEE